MLIFAASLIAGFSIWLVLRGVEIRLVLIGAGLAMATLAGRPLAIADSFGRSMVAAMIAPICASMGFAAVLAVTGCSRQLVNLLLKPLRHVRWSVIPGGIVAAYVVNLAVPSQAGTAAMLGPILLPLLLGVGASPMVAGAALVLGASFGGDLLNPGAQDVQSLMGVTGVKGLEFSVRIMPASVLGLIAATLTFTLQHRKTGSANHVPSSEDPYTADESLILSKALVPLVPITLLLLAHGGWSPLRWLIVVADGDQRPDLAAALPVVRSMLIGVVLAAAAGRRPLQDVIKCLFEGMGSAYRDIISLTISAQCFGAGLSAVGLGDALIGLFGQSRWTLAALSVGFPWGLAALSGSGSGPVLVFAEACLAPLHGGDGVGVMGALACLSAAFGRTMSPVSAVVLCSAGLAQTPPIALIRSLFPALLSGALTALAVVLASR